MEKVLRAEKRFYDAYITEGMTIFDVGANVGDLTLQFSQLAEKGVVHAFEACVATFKRLTERCEKAEASNIILNHVALSDVAGTIITLHTYDDEHSSWNTLATRPLKQYGINVEPVSTEEVAANTVDAYCERHGIAAVDLLKIDVEGAEYQVLLGARRMLQERRIGCCIFEYGGTTFDMGNRPEMLEDYLYSLGYRIKNLVKGDPIFPGRSSATTARFSMHIAMPLT